MHECKPLAGGAGVGAAPVEEVRWAGTPRTRRPLTLCQFLHPHTTAAAVALIVAAVQSSTSGPIIISFLVPIPFALSPLPYPLRPTILNPNSKS